MEVVVLKIATVLTTTFLFAAMLIGYPHSPASANHAIHAYSATPVPGYMHPRQRTVIAVAVSNGSRTQAHIRLARNRRHDPRKVRDSQVETRRHLS
jgi:hypothetical protein